MVKSWFIGIGMALMLFFAGCTQNVNIGNPASEYCVEQEGQLNIITNQDQNQQGMCVFDDGSMCDEWDFYRGECAKGDSIISSFDECVEAGFPIMESYPRKCSVGDKVFVEVVDSEENPGVCTMEYLPVCGVNGETFSNECFAQAENVDVAYEGVCGRENAYMDSKICTKEYNPVCGKDGVTYSNACEAGDMEIASSGECNSLEVPSGDIKSQCEENGGLWLEESSECEGISEMACSQMDGTFDECASACRNNPEADFCTMQCVFVCSFENAKVGELPKKADDPKMCTMEYAPVCGVDGKTYSNKCMAGDVEIDHFGECFNEDAKAECEEQGGKYEKAGMMQMYMCNMPASDAGDACEGSDECDGLCWSNGTCSEWTDNFGCFEILQDGEKTGLCID